MVGVARCEDVLGRTYQGHASQVWPQINLMSYVKSNRVKALATAKIIGPAQSKAIGCCHRVCNARVRFVTRQSYSLSIVAWGNLAHLAGTDEFCIDTLFLLHMHIAFRDSVP